MTKLNAHIYDFLINYCVTIEVRHCIQISIEIFPIDINGTRGQESELSLMTYTRAFGHCMDKTH